MSEMNGKKTAGFRLYTRQLSVDVHSSMGVILPSAPWRLVWALGQLVGADGKSLLEGYRAEDLCVTGVKTGYNGIGGKTVVPKEAEARLDVVIPDGKTAEDVRKDIREAFDRGGFADVEIKELD